MDYLHWIFLALYMTLAVAAMVTILLDNRQPAKTMAWVLVLMFLPVVGIILYFFFGQNVRKERAISQHSLDQLSRRSMLESHAQASLKIPPLYQRLVHLLIVRILPPLSIATRPRSTSTATSFSPSCSATSPPLATISTSTSSSSRTTPWAAS